MAIFLVTGAAGFIGRGLCVRLAQDGHQVVAAVRGTTAAGLPVTAHPVGEIGPVTDWREALRGVEIVVHLAQRAHRASDEALLATEPFAAVRLAEAAAATGARRLVYLSSIKAMGETTLPGRPFRADDPPHPADPYGRAKLASEQALAEAARRSGIELVVIRPPLVYGPKVGANFRALIGLAGGGLPLPFAALRNRRSLVYLDNLADLVATAAFHPQAAGRILLVRDGDDLSTPDLLRHLAAGLGHRARLFPLPARLLAVAGTLPVAGARLQPLLASLQVDDGATRIALQWHPPITAAEGLARTAATFRRG